MRIARLVGRWAVWRIGFRRAAADEEAGAGPDQVARGHHDA
jgi:hypothetical protein